ncbi:N-acetylmuramoyl-L-alanine amidase [Microaerobacter geothermalis]|uniref:N-acetylmuramoyl-L-alanine amidase family protein n=1 Tax=Microaerobacter geothermalis TaxID=674972 RepID=UPI001F382B66|nr:N-acetylmuramoyl-L-alanine amidase [Microaerobacter geothermalis]MCF6094279.1 N-acetylmuramoyl-L-alanine amidase [Microaerobacter geothermalis]
MKTRYLLFILILSVLSLFLVLKFYLTPESVTEIDKRDKTDTVIPLFQEANLPIGKVIIDPGHGGKEWGAVGWKSEVPEKEINLAIATYAKDYLENNHVEVAMTRYLDEMMDDKDLNADLTARAQFAEKIAADLFVSIHSDQFDKEIEGTRIFYSDKNPKVKESQILGEVIFDELISKLGSKPLGVKEENYRVLDQNTVPSVLIEVGFLSHPEEEMKLVDPAYQKKAGEAIAMGIIKYLKTNQRK